MMPTPSPERTPPKARHDMRLSVYANSIDGLAAAVREHLAAEGWMDPEQVAKVRQLCDEAEEDHRDWVETPDLRALIPEEPQP